MTYDELITRISLKVNNVRSISSLLLEFNQQGVANGGKGGCCRQLLHVKTADAYYRRYIQRKCISSKMFSICRKTVLSYKRFDVTSDRHNNDRGYLTEIQGCGTKIFIWTTPMNELFLLYTSTTRFITSQQFVWIS